MCILTHVITIPQTESIRTDWNEIQCYDITNEGYYL